MADATDSDLEQPAPALPANIAATPTAAPPDVPSAQPGLITSTLGEVNQGGMNLDLMPSTVTEREDPLGTLKQIGRGLENFTATTGFVLGDDTGGMTKAPEPSVSASVLNQKYGIKGPTPGMSLSFSGDMPESVAQNMFQAKQDENARANASARSPGGVGSTLADLGYGFLDPVGIAASALPVFGEARMGALLGRAGIDLGEGLLGRTALRGVTGAVDATTANLPLVGLRYGLSQQEHADYSMADAGRDLAFGALMGGVLHPLIGAGTDLLPERAPDPMAQAVADTPAGKMLDTNPDARAGVMEGATAAVMEDRPVVAGEQASILTAKEDTDPARAAQLQDQLTATRSVREAAGELPPEDAAVQSQADAAAKAAPVPRDAVPPGVAEQTTRLTGVLAPEEEAGRAEAAGQAAQPGEPDITQGNSDEPSQGTPYAQPPKEPTRLIQFLRESVTLQKGTPHEETIPGGLRDEGGDVAAIVGGNKGRPGLLSQSGRALDDAALHAWQAGYFPEHAERPDINALKDAIREDHNGNPRYSIHDQEAVSAYRNALAHNDEIEKFSAQTGIDPRGKTHAQFWDAVADHVSAEQSAEAHARMEGEQSDAFEAFERAAKEHVADIGDAWNTDEFYGKSQPRTLDDLESEDLEREYAEEQASPTAQQRTGGDEQPGSAGQPAGDGENSVRQDGRPAGSTGRDGAEGGAGSADADAAEPAARLDPEYEAELKSIADAEQASQGRLRALAQAAACIARGVI